MKHKTEVFEIFQRHVSRSELMTGYKLKHIRTDNRIEFNNVSFSDFCNKTDVHHEFTNIYTPEQDGVCERANQTILNCVHSILTHSLHSLLNFGLMSVFIMDTHRIYCVIVIRR